MRSIEGLLSRHPFVLSPIPNSSSIPRTGQRGGIAISSIVRLKGRLCFLANDLTRLSIIRLRASSVVRTSRLRLVHKRHVDDNPSARDSLNEYSTIFSILLQHGQSFASSSPAELVTVCLFLRYGMEIASLEAIYANRSVENVNQLHRPDLIF